ncbi:MAG: TonB-dependent receptor plug domain-containing protein [Rhizomicrobium sp.]
MLPRKKFEKRCLAALQNLNVFAKNLILIFSLMSRGRCANQSNPASAGVLPRLCWVLHRFLRQTLPSANKRPRATNPRRMSKTVTVTGKRTTLDIVTTKVLNTPQSIDVVPHEVITQQGVSSLQDALKNVPGITLNAGEGGSHGDQVNLRGFSAGDDFFLDGLRDTGFYTRDTFNDQNLEVFKGPSIDPVRPRIDGRRGQSGQQEA